MKKNIFLLGLSAILITACGTDTKPNAGDLPPGESGITLSIACFESEQIEKAYVAHCYVHTVDGNSDPVSGVAYNVSLVNSVKVFGQETGNILTTDPITFSDYNENFVQNGVKQTDTLIVLPTVDKTDVTYLGNWQVAGVNNNTNLTLAERSFNLETTEELTYVIGSETRYDLGGSASAHIEYLDNNATSGDELGFFYFDVVYDPELKGETIFLGAHTTSANRMGAALALRLELEDANTTTP